MAPCYLGDLIHEVVDSCLLGSGYWHDGDAEAFGKAVDVDLVASRFHHIHHVQRYDHWGSHVE